MILRAPRAASSDDDEIQRGQIVLTESKRFANDPADSIPLDPVPGDLQRYRESEACCRRSAGIYREAEVLVAEASTASLDDIELRLATDSPDSRQRVARAIGRARNHKPPVALRNQLLASLRTPSAQHEPAGLSGHARAEAVGALAAQLARLVGSFHGLGARKKAGKAKP